MSNPGSALLFPYLLAASTIISLYLLLYMARCILTVVEGTAAGQDDVKWSDEIIIDWLGRSVSLVGLAVIWAVPAGIAAYVLRNTWLVKAPLSRNLLLIVLSLWIFFPIGMLSSLSSISRWVFLRPLIVVCMLRLLPVTLLFYLLSALIGILGAAPWYLVVFGDLPWLLVLAAPLSAACVLIYARLLGRLGEFICQLAPLFPEKIVHKSALPSASPPRKRSKVVDPWAIAEGEPVPPPEPSMRTKVVVFEEDGDVTEPYALVDDAKKVVPPSPSETAPRTKVVVFEEDGDVTEPYALVDDVKKTVPPAPSETATARTESHYRSPRGGRPTRKPGVSMLRGIWGFPWYGTSLAAWTWLSLGSAVLGSLLIALRIFFPF